jgi:predicted nucleotidyltransferase
MSRDIDVLHRVLEPLENEPNVLAACLIGSYARDTSIPDTSSDIDIVAIFADDVDDATRSSLVRSARSGERESRPIELRTITYSALQRLVERRTVYGAHLAREARILFDHDGAFARFRAAFPLTEPIPETADHLRSRFSLYEHLDWCNGRYLFCLADFYGISRSGVMLGLAQRGIFEFDRHRVFDRFAECHPASGSNIQIVRELEPFYMLVRRKAGTADELPFSPTNCHAEAIAARDACSTLLTWLK